MTTDRDTARLLDALVGLVTVWTDARVQSRIAAAVGLPLDPTAIRAVYLIGARGGSLGSTALAEHGGLTRPTVSKLVTRLEELGLVTRERSGRSVEVTLTPAGSSAYATLVEAGTAMVRRAVPDWSAQETTQFADQAQRFLTALSHTTAAPAATPTKEKP